MIQFYIREASGAEGSGVGNVVRAAAESCLRIKVCDQIGKGQSEEADDGRLESKHQDPWPASQAKPSHPDLNLATPSPFKRLLRVLSRITDFRF